MGIVIYVFIHLFIHSCVRSSIHLFKLLQQFIHSFLSRSYLAITFIASLEKGRRWGKNESMGNGVGVRSLDKVGEGRREGGR